MKIGLYIRLLGRPGGQPPPPSWSSVRDQALAAEAAGFDLVVLEDALLYPDDDGSVGVWESVSMVAAVAAATSTIGVGHAVMNSPYRPPALTAKIAATLDEIAGGRYTFGIGLGNTPDDYPLFGIDANPRYSRFAEAIQIIHGMLHDGRTDFEGTYYRAPGAELVLRGPRPAGPPIIIAAGRPRAMRLVARYADEWNWWIGEADGTPKLRELVAEMGRACEEVGRDPRPCVAPSTSSRWRPRVSRRRLPRRRAAARRPAGSDRRRTPRLWSARIRGGPRQAPGPGGHTPNRRDRVDGGGHLAPPRVNPASARLVRAPPTARRVRVLSGCSPGALRVLSAPSRPRAARG